MLINNISITYGRKINLGDYNNANIEVTIGADIELGEDLNAVMQELWSMAKANVRAQALPLLAKGKETPSPVISLGLSNSQHNGIESSTNGTANGIANGSHP